MKMTLEKALGCPRGMNFEEYAERLAKLEKVQNKLYRLSTRRDELEDALEILADEIGSERWKKKKDELDKVNDKMIKLLNEYKGGKT